MGDKTGGGEFRLYPISYQSVGMYISKGFHLTLILLMWRIG
jgi:hypothetical protein